MTKEFEFDKKVERETIAKLNTLFGYKRRSYYDSEKAKERRQQKKELEIKKHIENCREPNCPIKLAGEELSK